METRLFTLVRTAVTHARVNGYRIEATTAQAIDMATCDAELGAYEPEEILKVLRECLA
jgi:hypothetical protein